MLKQYADEGITRLLRAALASYVRYFNARHQRYGALFQDSFKASGPHGPTAARKIVAYIHLNPLDLRGTSWESYEHSGHATLLTAGAPSWLDSRAAHELFRDRAAYDSFMGAAERTRRNLARELSALWTPG